MNPKTKVIIAGITFLTLSFFLTTGCVSQTGVTPPPVSATSAPESRIEQAKEVLKTAFLVFSSKEEGNDVVVTISIQNPEQKPITSVQAWLAYNPDDLLGKMIDVKDSPFEIPAPYASDFDSVSGLISIGRSTSTPLTDSLIEVAKIIFEKNTEGATMLDIYDYRPDLSGHTSVNTLLEGTPYNILKKPDSPVLIIQSSHI